MAATKVKKLCLVMGWLTVTSLLISCNRQTTKTGSTIPSTQSPPPPHNPPPLPPAPLKVTIADSRWPQAWSDDLASLIASDTTFLQHMPQDIDTACSNYFTLNQSGQIGAAVYLFYAMALFESGLNPDGRFVEPGLGNDAVTGQPIVSEGLLQTSYQDAQYYKCAFIWAQDSHLKPTDPTKTIFEPEAQFDCGIRIMDRQFTKIGQVFPSTSFYWSTLNPSASDFSSLVGIVQKAPGCQ